MSDIRRRLARLAAAHDRLRVNKPKRVNHDFAFDGLDRVDDYTNGTGIQRFEGLGSKSKSEPRDGVACTHLYLLCVYIGTRQPTAEAGMGVIPPDDHFRSCNDHRKSVALNKCGTLATHRPVCFSISSILVWKT